MQVFISGKQIDVGSALREYVENELNNSVKKYFDDAIRADVFFSKSKRRLFKADIVVNEGTGTHILIKSNAEENDIYASFDKACERIEKQLRRYKRRLKDHHKARLEDSISEVLSATKYVLSSADEEEEVQEDNPLIIAEKVTQIEELTVSDAVMRMDLGNVPALMFVNKKTGSVNVIYRREDGNISWIDSSNLQSAQNAA